MSQDLQDPRTAARGHRRGRGYFATVIVLGVGIGGLGVVTPPGRRLVRALDPSVGRFEAECARANPGDHWEPVLLAGAGYCSVSIHSPRDGPCMVELGPQGAARAQFLDPADPTVASESHRVACERIASVNDLQAAMSLEGAVGVERCYQASLLGDLVTCFLEIGRDMRIATRRPEQPTRWDSPLVRGR
jgi:hypothetical protein